MPYEEQFTRTKLTMCLPKGQEQRHPPVPERRVVARGEARLEWGGCQQGLTDSR